MPAFGIGMEGKPKHEPKETRRRESSKVERGESSIV
jgi:hypothetical protein